MTTMMAAKECCQALSAKQLPPSTYELLVQVSSPERQLNATLFADVDWEALLLQGRHHSLMPLLANGLLECGDSLSLPTQIRIALKAEFQRNLFRNLGLLEALKCILAAWRQAGIEGIPYKGPVLAEQLWGSFALRECSDLDLLVRRQDVERAGAALDELGYARVSPVLPSLRSALLRNASEEQFRHTPSDILLELQWAPAPRTLAINYDEELLWRNIRLISVAGQQVSAPSAENLIGLLAIHGWKHNWSKLIWVADLAALVNSTNVDWDLVYRCAQRGSWTRILLLGLEMVRRVYGLKTPLTADEGLIRLAKELEQRLRAAENVRYLDWHRDMLRARDGRVDQVRQLRNFIVTPGLGEYASLELPAWASPAYRIVRISRVLRLSRKRALK